MSTSIYEDKLIEPDDKMLSYDLAGAKKYLDKICQFIENEYGDLKPEWKFYSKKSGWILKLFNKKRNVLFIAPCEEYFRAAFTLGNKAADVVFNSQLPEAIKKDLFEAKKYAEGRTILIDVRNEEDCKNILDLVRIKLAN